MSLLQIDDPDYLDFNFYDLLDFFEPAIFEEDEDEEDEDSPS